MSFIDVLCTVQLHCINVGWVLSSNPPLLFLHHQHFFFVLGLCFLYLHDNNTFLVTSFIGYGLRPLTQAIM